MSITEPGLQRLRMSWDDYLALPEEPRAEWVDGVVVMSPRPAAVHAAVVARLSATLVAALPGLEVLADSGVWLPGNRLRGPDVMVVAQLPATTWVEEVPVLVVEVLSPSTRTEDTVVKSPEYARAGIEQFWVVDPAHRTLDVHVNVDRRWELLLHLDDASPTGELGVGEHVVPLDLTTLLPAQVGGPPVGG